MKMFSFVIPILFALSSTSCDSGSPSAPAPQVTHTPQVKISLLMKDAPTEITKIVGVLSRTSYQTISTPFTIANDTASCEFDNLATGLWHLQVNAYDNNDSLQFTGQTDVEVNAGQTTPVTLTLNATTGSINVTVTWGKTASNHTLLFNEQGSSVQFAPSTAFHLQELTVEMYVQVNNTDTVLVPLLCETSLDQWSYADGFDVKWEAGWLYFRVAVKSNKADYACSPYSFKMGEWVHLACTYDHESLRIYVNGNLLVQKPYSTDIYYGSHGFSLGSVTNSYYGGTHYLGGMMDEVRIWNYARSQTQINQTMNLVLQGNEPGLIGYWNCEQGTYTNILSDKTSFDHDGTLSGGVSFAISNLFTASH